jgi:diaminohydroxyphosphoribosylaminopyrimidine deaminase/5-amino-6-(5-phosphoribosylamino)uracil reductase
VCTTEKASAEKIKAVQKRGARVIVARHENGMVDLVDAFLRLAKEGIMSLLVEGGRRLFTSIFNLSLFDKLILFLAPKIVGEPHLSFVQTLRDTVYFDFMRTKRVGKDLLCEGYPRDVYGYNKGSGQGL